MRPALLAASCWLAACGGAIQAQARAATVAVVALEGAHRLTMDEAERRLDECRDESCTAAVERDMAPVAAAHDAARVALSGWVEALQLALVAGDDGDVVAALGVAAGRWLALWGELSSFLAGLGVVLPALPAGIVEEP
jgi:hypothetical protein